LWIHSAAEEMERGQRRQSRRCGSPSACAPQTTIALRWLAPHGRAGCRDLWSKRAWFCGGRRNDDRSHHGRVPGLVRAIPRWKVLWARRSFLQHAIRGRSARWMTFFGPHPEKGRPRRICRSTALSARSALHPKEAKSKRGSPTYDKILIIGPIIGDLCGQVRLKHSADRDAARENVLGHSGQ